MLRLIARYTRWLHTGWPAGHIEKLPLANEDGSTNVPGLYLVLFQNSAECSCRFSIVMIEEPAEPLSTGDPT